MLCFGNAWWHKKPAFHKHLTCQQWVRPEWCSCCMRTVAAVSGPICSSHLTSFLSHCSLSLWLCPCYPITRLQDALTLSPPFFYHPAPSSGKECGKAVLSRLHYAPDRLLVQTKESRTCTCSSGSLSPKKHWTHTRQWQNVDNLLSRRDKGSHTQCICAHTPFQ